MFNPYRRKTHNPIIPTPPAKEVPVTEILVTPEHHGDVRPTMHKKPAPLHMPHYNDIYDSLRSEHAWRYVADSYANGTLTTVAGSQVSAAIKLNDNAFRRLSQWPDAVQLYLYLRFFGIAPQTNPATVGNIECLYQDTIGGATFPIGEFTSNTGGNIGGNTIIPSPITDPGNVNVGNLLVTLNTGATTAVYNWSMGFSFVYMRPSTRRYGTEEEHDVS